MITATISIWIRYRPLNLFDLFLFTIKTDSKAIKIIKRHIFEDRIDDLQEYLEINGDPLSALKENLEINSQIQRCKNLIDY